MDFWSLTKQLKQEWLVIHLQFLSIQNGSTLFTLTCFLCVCVFLIQFLANQEFVRARTFLRKLEVSVWRVFQTANCHTKEVIKSVTIFLVVTKDKRDFDSGTINMMHQGDLL